MVSKEMKKFGKVVETMDQKEYRKLEGLLKENLPMHVPIEIEREENKTKVEINSFGWYLHVPYMLANNQHISGTM